MNQHATEIKMSFSMVGPTQLWVVRIPNPNRKKGDKRKMYARASSGVFIGVFEKRLATRFDSAIWAGTVAALCGYKGAKVVPVKFKAKSQTWVYKKSRTEVPGTEVKVDDKGVAVTSDKPIEVTSEPEKTGTDQ